MAFARALQRSSVLQQSRLRGSAINVAVASRCSPTNPYRYSAQTAAATEEELVNERLYTKICIKTKGFDHAVLDSYMKFTATAAKALGIKIDLRLTLPTSIKKWTLLKSPHIYKKHRVQYEMRTHARLLQIGKITGTTADVFLEYIQRNLPEGVTMCVTQEEMEELPKLLVDAIDQDLQEQQSQKKGT